MVLFGTFSMHSRYLSLELGMPPLTLHGIRHAFVTLALKQKIHPKIVSEALGHSKIVITLNLYSHVIPDMQDELADAVADVLTG